MNVWTVLKIIGGFILVNCLGSCAVNFMQGILDILEEVYVDR